MSELKKENENNEVYERVKKLDEMIKNIKDEPKKEDISR